MSSSRAISPRLPVSEGAAISEPAAFAGYICRTLERIMTCLDGLDADGLNWIPPAPNANSLHAIAEHAIANAEENVLGIVCHLDSLSQRVEEFSTLASTAEPLRGRAVSIMTRIRESLAALSAEDLRSVCSHPRRGSLPAYEVLIVAARHAAEHQGQAELTRDLLLAHLSSNAGRHAP